MRVTTTPAAPTAISRNSETDSLTVAQEETMAQASITNYYGIRALKRKFTADGEPIASKVHLLDCDHASRAVTKLTFDDNPTPVKNPPPVPFRKLGALSPVKNAPSAPRPRREPTLVDIKKALTKSSRLAELKARINTFNTGYVKLQGQADQSSSKAPEKAALKEFKSIELLVPVSPKKPSSPFTSPVKEAQPLFRSPIKSPTKLPAYQRYSSLTATGATLTLPHHYRWLAEVFRAVETACSLLHNRRETITFSKVKAAAQEMLKRNITEKHLEQIKHLSPNMYSFSRDKIKSFGMTSKRDEYDLVLTPNIIDQITGSPVSSMNPNVILERRRSFYNLLVEKVKDHHDAFLITLDPPLIISRVELKCWHPEFDLEKIPDVESDALPAEPYVERYSTAQDVLSKAREMFSNNPRVERALQRLAEVKAKERNEEVVGQKSVATQLSQSTTQTSALKLLSEVPLVNPALKGIPSALLQKVKARQAEKALQTMTRTLMQSENILLYQRLPDLAKIVRNVFVTEKKCVLPLDTVISKLDNSFVSKISNVELTKLLKSLSAEVPEWLTFHIVRKVEFLKMAKMADMTSITTKLETLASKHMI